MTEIKYIRGDVREPVGEGKKLIVHCCNDLGAMGAGVALAILKKWPVVKERYVAWYKHKLPSFELGCVQYVDVEDDITVGNMIGQHGVGKDKNGNPPIRYDAIRKCLKNVRDYCKNYSATFHAPRFGSDLAGGDWNEIEKIIKEELTNKDFPVTIYLFD